VEYTVVQIGDRWYLRLPDRTMIRYPDYQAADVARNLHSQEPLPGERHLTPDELQAYGYEPDLGD
jgi:hypothetical protein